MSVVKSGGPSSIAGAGCLAVGTVLFYCAFYTEFFSDFYRMSVQTAATDTESTTTLGLTSQCIDSWTGDTRAAKRCVSIPTDRLGCRSTRFDTVVAVYKHLARATIVLGIVGLLAAIMGCTLPHKIFVSICITVATLSALAGGAFLGAFYGLWNWSCYGDIGFCARTTGLNSQLGIDVSCGIGGSGYAVVFGILFNLFGGLLVWNGVTKTLVVEEGVKRRRKEDVLLQSSRSSMGGSQRGSMRRVPSNISLISEEFEDYGF